MASPDFDPYTLLGVVPNATPDEIRAAYRRQAAACHPDIQPLEKKPWASEQMIQLNAARDLLLNTRRRVQYHREHADHLQWTAEKTRWRTKEAQAAYAHAPGPAAGQPPPGARDQIYTLILLGLAGLAIFVIVALLSLWKAPAGLLATLRDAWSVTAQQAMIWMAVFGGFFLAALQVLFLAVILALILFGVTRWWRH
jgi:curved DNA-binding protein CbpA